MQNTENISIKRTILLTTRMRFSPEVQPVKYAAIDKILLQVLFSNNEKEDLSSDNIQKLLSFENCDFILNIEEIENSLIRLLNEKK